MKAVLVPASVCPDPPRPGDVAPRRWPRAGRAIFECERCGNSIPEEYCWTRAMGSTDGVLFFHYPRCLCSPEEYMPCFVRDPDGVPVQ